MRSKFAFLIAVALFCAGISCLGGIDLPHWKTGRALAQALTGAGIGTQASGGGYTPPLDAIGQASVNVAYSTCRMFTAYNSTLIAVTTIGGSTTNYPALTSGCVDWTAIGSQCPTASSCSVIFKDQSGNGHDTSQGAACSSSATCVLIDPTNKWVNCNNPTASGNYLTYTDIATNQPYTFVINYNNHSFLNNNDILSLANGNFLYNLSGTLTVGFSNTITIAISNNTWGALSVLVNGASSAVAVNNGGSPSGTNLGAGNLTASTSGICTNAGSATYFSSDMYFDIFVEFNSNPGSSPLSTFVTWVRANMHT